MARNPNKSSENASKARKAKSETTSKKFFAKCTCGAENTADTKSIAIDFLIHENGCTVDMTSKHWEDWITVKP